MSPEEKELGEEERKDKTLEIKAEEGIKGGKYRRKRDLGCDKKTDGPKAENYHVGLEEKHKNQVTLLC